jgi:ornithine cyclodeaminase/alanine dehydrogenase-like protein (mu-crystallin family)
MITTAKKQIEIAEKYRKIEEIKIAGNTQRPKEKCNKKK